MIIMREANDYSYKSFICDVVGIPTQLCIVYREFHYAYIIYVEEGPMKTNEKNKK